MLITGIEQRSARKYIVRIDHQYSLLLDRKEMKAYEIREDGEISEDAFGKLMEQQRRNCLQRCGALLKDRDYPEDRLRGKLSEAGYDSTVVSSVLLSLKEAGYVDDLRFADNYVKFHIGDRSRMRIRQDLMKRGMSAGVIDKAFSELDPGKAEAAEERQIRELFRKRNFSVSGASYEEKQKMMAFLYGKGYTNELIRRVFASSHEQIFP